MARRLGGGRLGGGRLEGGHGGTGLRAWLVAGVLAVGCVLGTARQAPSQAAEAAAEPGFAGLQVQAADHASRTALGATEVAGGVLVRDIAPGGPGESAGLARGDLLLRYEGVALSGLTQLVSFMQGSRPGTTATFLVRRHGTDREIALPLVSWPKGWRIERPSTAVSPGFGTTVTALTQDIRDTVGVRWGRVGVLVAKVEAGSPAEAGGLKAGDLLVAIGRSIVAEPAEVETLAAAAGKRWMALVERNAEVLLVGPGAPPPHDVVAGDSVLAARTADGPYVLDIALGAPAEAVRTGRLKALPRPAVRPEAAEKVVGGAGLRVATLSEQARARWPVRWSGRGVVVVAVEPGSRASLAGLRPGHVIRSLNQTAVEGIDDLGPLEDEAASVMVVAEDLAGFTILTVEPKGGVPHAAPAERPVLQWGKPSDG